MWKGSKWRKRSKHQDIVSPARNAVSTHRPRRPGRKTRWGRVHRFHVWGPPGAAAYHSFPSLAGWFLNQMYCLHVTWKLLVETVGWDWSYHWKAGRVLGQAAMSVHLLAYSLRSWLRTYYWTMQKELSELCDPLFCHAFFAPFCKSKVLFGSRDFFLSPWNFLVFRSIK